MPISISALICDDIRQEINGKMILIGAITDSIVVASFPVELYFDCVIRFRGLPKDAEYMELTIQHVGFEKEINRFEFPSVNDGCSTMVIFGFPLKAKRSGKFSLLISVEGGRRHRVESLHIVEDAESASD